ncbi:MAG: phosphate signaling complex protein PhoU [Acidobacteriota bacterium]
MFNQDLTQLRDKLLMMGGAAERAIAQVTRALVERDADLAERVITEDDAIDQFELEIDAMCAEMLLKKSLTSAELRLVLTIARTAPGVERIADHAVNIAKHGLVINSEPELELRIDIARLARIVREMLIAGLDAFTSGDIERAQTTIARDDEVDSLYDIFYSQVIDTMRQDAMNVSRGAEWLFILKHFERIADYATNICEQTVFLARGQVIKHTIW